MTDSFNSYLVLILALLIGEYLLDTAATLLNLKSFRPELPREFEGYYDPQKFRTALLYQNENARLGLFQRAFWLVLTIGFLLAGGFNSVDHAVRGTGQGPIVTGLLYLGALGLLRAILSLPFSIYSTFVIEEKYGFNRTTPKTFMLDLVKGTALSILIGAPILALILYFFENAGPLAWLYCWIAVTAFQLLLAFLAPAVILPMFNKFEPLPEGELKESIQAYARKQDFQLSGIFRMDSSKRSTKSNAFFTGFGKFRRLVLFDTLIEKHSRDELVAVLAHEIGHFKKKHIPRSMALSIAASGLLFYLASLLINNRDLFSAFRMDNLSIYASLVFISILYGPGLRPLSVFAHYLSRKHEFEADAYAAETYGHAEDLVTALKKLSVDNLSNPTPHPFKVALDYTHPPVLQRISALRRAST